MGLIETLFRHNDYRNKLIQKTKHKIMYHNKSQRTQRATSNNLLYYNEHKAILYPICKYYHAQHAIVHLQHIERH